MATISHIKTPGTKLADNDISPSETSGLLEPSPADVQAGMTTLRMCRAASADLPLMVRASIIASMAAEFLACWPAPHRGEVLRVLNAQIHMALEVIDPTPPGNAA